MALPLVVAGAGVAQYLAKWAVARPRPNLEEWGFPSAHVLSLVVLCGYLAYAVSSRSVRRRQRLAMGVCALVVGIVAYSRMYLDVHWLSDIIGGFTAGLAYLLLAIWAVESAPRLRRALRSTPLASGGDGGLLVPAAAGMSADLLVVSAATIPRSDRHGRILSLRSREVRATWTSRAARILLTACLLGLGALPAHAQEEFTTLFSPELGQLLDPFRVSRHFLSRSAGLRPAGRARLDPAGFLPLGARATEHHRRVVRLLPPPEPGVRHGSRASGYRRAVPGRAVEHPDRHDLSAPLRLGLDGGPERQRRVAERQALREHGRAGRERDGRAPCSDPRARRVALLPELWEQPGVLASHPHSWLRILVPAIRPVRGRPHDRPHLAAVPAGRDADAHGVLHRRPNGGRAPDLPALPPGSPLGRLRLDERALSAR